MQSRMKTQKIKPVVSQQNAASAVESYLERQQNISLLRFITCGSVDDGKSTMIGRL